MSELLRENKSGWEKMSDELKEKIFQFSKEYIDFLNKSKTEREIVSSAEQMARERGFRSLDEYSELHPGDKVYYVNRGKNIYLAVIGQRDLEEGINIIGAHADSPRLDLKPNPLYQSGDFSYFTANALQKAGLRTIRRQLYHNERSDGKIQQARQEKREKG